MGEGTAFRHPQLYGTTNGSSNYQRDGYSCCGTVFKLKPGAQGKCKKTILRIFKGTYGAQVTCCWYRPSSPSPGTKEVGEAEASAKSSLP
jgi:hypothetical protein